MFVDHLMFLSRDLLHEGLFFFVFLMTSFFFFLRVISSFGVVFCLRLSAKYLRVSFFSISHPSWVFFIVSLWSSRPSFLLSSVPN